jgi:hypothetical protein
MIHPECRTKFNIKPSDVVEMTRDITRQAAKRYEPLLVQKIDGSRPDSASGSLAVHPDFKIYMKSKQSNAYFAMAAKDLHDMGFTILGDIICVEGAPAIDYLLRGVVNGFSGLGNNRGSEDPWSKIYNPGESGEEDSAA